MRHRSSPKNPVSVRAISPDALGDVEGLIQAYPYKPFRNYRVLSRRRQDEVLRAEILAALQPGGFGVAAGTPGADAAAIVRPLPWDSEFFGMPMAKVTYVLREANTPAAVVRTAVDAALRGCRERGIQHVSARIDVADADTIQILEDAGFRMMDALATSIYHPKRAAPEPMKEMGVLRLFQPEDTAQILDITREAYRGFRGRYHLDPHLARERSDELYIEWARKCLSGQWADVVLVTENGQGDVHGWASYRQLEPVSTVGGMPIRGGGLGACRRDKPGAYAGLIRAAIVRIHCDGAVTECQTQIFNFPTIRVYEAVGTQFVRADYTLHAWLGEQER